MRNAAPTSQSPTKAPRSPHVQTKMNWKKNLGAFPKQRGTAAGTRTGSASTKRSETSSTEWGGEAHRRMGSTGRCRRQPWRRTGQAARAPGYGAEGEVGIVVWRARGTTGSASGCAPRRERPWAWWRRKCETGRVMATTKRKDAGPNSAFWNFGEMNELDREPHGPESRKE